MNKLCTNCGDEKDIEVFSRDKSRKDGRQSQCKECRRKHSKTEKGKAAQKRYNKKRHKRDQVKAKAIHAVNNAIRAGKLKRPLYCCVDSSECKGRIEGHHWDYSRPLDVTWLCQKHHRFTHQQIERGSK